MAYPTKYTRQYDYVSYQNANPARPLPAGQIHADYNAIAQSLQETIDFIKKALRADGALQNGTVTNDSLSAELITAGLQPAVPWESGVEYQQGTTVFQNSAVYRCLTAHVSGMFSTDLAAGKWLFLTDVMTGPAGTDGTDGANGTDGTNGPGYGGTSATSVTITTGVHAFTTQSGLAYTDGARVRATNTADPSRWMEGVATYSGITLTINVDKINGSGTYASWNLNLAGEPGAASLTAASMADLQTGTPNTWADAQLLFQLLFADSLIQNNTTDANNDIDVLLDGSAVVTKRLDAAWAAGTNQGGLDTGSKAINSTYHLYLLRKNADGTLDALFSASATAPTIPSGYTKVRVLGAVTTNGSGNIRAFQQFGDYFQLVVGVREASGVAVNPSATFVTLTAVPHGVKVMARFFFDIANAGGAGGYGSCWDADLGIGADVSSAKLAVLIHTTGLTEAGGQVTCPTSAAGQIAVYDSASGSAVTISTQGWYDPRVRRHAI